MSDKPPKKNKRPITADELEVIAEAIDDCSRRVRFAVQKMRESKLQSVVANIDSVRNHYLVLISERT